MSSSGHSKGRWAVPTERAGGDTGPYRTGLPKIDFHGFCCPAIDNPLGIGYDKKEVTQSAREDLDKRKDEVYEVYR